jgi:hypothetical protein
VTAADPATSISTDGAAISRKRGPLLRAAVVRRRQQNAKRRDPGHHRIDVAGRASADAGKIDLEWSCGVLDGVARRDQLQAGVAGEKASAGSDRASQATPRVDKQTVASIALRDDTAPPRHSAPGFPGKHAALAVHRRVPRPSPPTRP